MQLANQSSNADSQLDALREVALHASLASRLRRSYLHEMRNGLQGLYVGFDALTRANQSPSLQATAERAATLLKQALGSHEQSLQRILDHLLVREEPPAVVDLGSQVRDVVRFLGNEAAVRQLSLQAECIEALYATLRVDKIRLVLLSLAVDAIDSATRSGALKCAVTLVGDRPTVELSLLLEDEKSKLETSAPHPEIAGDAGPRAPWRALIFPVARSLVAADRGTLHCTGDELAWQSVRISYPPVETAQSIAG